MWHHLLTTLSSAPLNAQSRCRLAACIMSFFSKGDAGTTHQPSGEPWEKVRSIFGLEPLKLILYSQCSRGIIRIGNSKQRLLGAFSGRGKDYRISRRCFYRRSLYLSPCNQYWIGRCAYDCCLFGRQSRNAAKSFSLTNVNLIYYRSILVPHKLPDQLHMDALFDHVAFNDAPHVADACGSPAITAQPCFHTGVLEPIADVVDRCGIVLDPRHGGF